MGLVTHVPITTDICYVKYITTRLRQAEQIVCLSEIALEEN